ncbi:hypothetical protein QBC40DRAFT_186126 [Triangularia verruculosa]|uniref:6-methylsalicylate decarboxylase n=1 Tax=Triangularia verruculosa TaxID=2587418 RepID=A0AAN7ANH2_9PEZI|nr:hypothetical protein QBC40DRAFT_186126 [Triangularia verruculosa]
MESHTTSPAPYGLIDVHIHALPPAYLAAIEAAGGDPSGFPSPNWSPEEAVHSLDLSGASFGILSVSAPGVSIAGIGQTARDLARALNAELADYAASPIYSSRLSFFGVLPDWQDVDGTLEELDFLFSQQRLSKGVTIFTSYGSYLLSNPLFKPIWDKLNHYRALIFLHPTTLDITPRFVAGGLPQPVIDYPIATTRAVVDLIFSGIMRDYPDIDTILSHAGGTLPYLANRIECLMMNPALANLTNISLTDVKASIAKFHFDTALSTSAAQLHSLLDVTSPSRILFGTDFPYAGKEAIAAVVQQYHSFVADDPLGPALGPEVLRQNTLSLLERHKHRDGQRQAEVARPE